jgi:predicted TIM-barrel fold metal-dependent hydrolase
VPVILSHCGTDATSREICGVMARHANVYCDLSHKAPPVWNPSKRTQARIFEGSGIESDWRRLIEEFPDRFMIGTDACCCDYSETIAIIRKGLLAQLTPATPRKAAYENAQRVMKLK